MAKTSQGTKLYISDGGSPTAFTAVGKVTNFSGPNSNLPTLDSSDLDSLAVERIAGLLDEGNFTFELNSDAANVTTHATLETAHAAGTRLEFKLVLTSTSRTYVWFGYVTQFTPKGAVNQVIKASLGIAVDGQVMRS